METEDILKNLDEKLTTFKGNLATKNEVAEIEKNIKEMKETQINPSKIEEIEKGLNAIEQKVSSFKKAEVKNIGGIIEDNFEGIQKTLKDGKDYSLFITKDALSNASIVDNTVAYRVSGVGQIANNGAPFLNTLAFQSISEGNGNHVVYWDNTGNANVAAGIAELGAYPEETLTFQEYSKPLEKFGELQPVSEEVLVNQKLLEAEIVRILKTNVYCKTNAELVADLMAYAPNFNAGAYAGAKTKNPNIFDLMLVLKTEITKGKKSKYNPNFVLINPSNALSMSLAKTTTEIPVRNMYMSGDTFAGMTIIEDSSITEGHMIVGDSRYLEPFDDGKGLEVTLGHNGTDFGRDAISLKVRQFLLLLVRNSSLDGFLECTNIADALTAITQA